MGREDQSANFIDWLSALGFPVNFYEAKPDAPHKECTCALDNVCELHTCQCSACGQHGTDKMKCLWRASINTFLKEFLLQEETGNLPEDVEEGKERQEAEEGAYLQGVSAYPEDLYSPDH